MMEQKRFAESRSVELTASDNHITYRSNQQDFSTSRLGLSARGRSVRESAIALPMSLKGVTA